VAGAFNSVSYIFARVGGVPERLAAEREIVWGSGLPSSISGVFVSSKSKYFVCGRDGDVVVGLSIYAIARLDALEKQLHAAALYYCRSGRWTEQPECTSGCALDFGTAATCKISLD